ncbi:MAG TPA: YCF48-related protein [Chitinophagales bacterium]|nr:YCF48-related protein [Chitinophagales bacterium]
MKKIYVLLILLSLKQITSAQQWSQIGTAFSSTVRGLYFENPDTGYAVGQDISAIGQIAKTVDGGVTWTSTSFDQSNLLRSVTFVNMDTGFVCGAFGTDSIGLVFKTEDGGSNWTLIFSDTFEYFRAVDFISRDTGFLAGNNGTILKTTDGGTTWSTYNLGQDTSDVIQLNMVNSQIGYAVCAGPSYPFNPGFVFKTSNGGATWDTVYYSADVGLLGLAVVDTAIAYAGGSNQTVVKTTDGGVTWDTVYSGLSNAIRAGFAVSADTIYMVDEANHILRTDDAGVTWTPDTTIGAGGLYSIYFPTPSIGYTADGVGSVFKKAPCQPLASIDSVSGSELVCQGDTILYSVEIISGATNYSWEVPVDATIIGGNGSTSVIVLFGDFSGNILVIATNECDTTFASLAVVVNALPDMPVITFSNDTLMSSSAATYQWYYNGSLIPGATDQTYSPTQDGFYTVAVTNDGDCQATSLPFQVIGMSVDDMAGSIGLEIFPNPLSTTAVIFMGGNPSMQYLSITDVQGKILREMTINQDQKITIDRKDFTAGMYFISLMNNNHELIARSKLVVQ